MRRVNKNKIIIFSLIGLLFLLVAGYAAFQTKLEIKGTSNISSEWRIEITDVSVASKNGLAESVDFSHTKTTASMEANLYEKGDYAIYDVEVSNLGTLDATIDNIANNIKSSNEAVKISFSGYAKGQILKAKEKQTIKVKIEYDSNYSGEVPAGPAEVEIQPEYVQQSPGSTEPAPNKYLVSYDCETNGGSCTNYDEYLLDGNNVNLNYSAEKNGYTFVGWNTDKNAETKMESLSINKSNVTLYAIYKKTINVTYAKGENISTISKENDICNLYNNDANCEVTLPTAVSKEGYNVDGWYEGNTKYENKISINSDKNLVAKGIDNIAPTDPEIKTIYNIWGSKEYQIYPYPGGNYESDAGIDGTWVINGNDPNLVFGGVSNIKKISGAYVELDSALERDMRVEVFFSDTDSFVQEVSAIRYLKTGETKILIPYNIDGCNYIRFDIGGSSDNGLSYKIKRIGIVAEAGQANDNDILNYVVSTDKGSGIDKYEVLSGTEWASEGLESFGTGVIKVHTSEGSISTKFRAVDKAGNISKEVSSSGYIDKSVPTLTVSTSATTNSITVVANASAPSGISKYEYSIDGGSTWVSSDTNTHTFNGLTNVKAYDIKVRVTSGFGNSAVETVSETTKTLSAPTFNQTTDTEVTINYPEGCGGKLTCTYEYNDKTSVTVTGNSINVPIDQAGNIVAKVSDGTNNVSSNHIVLYNELYVSSTGNDSMGYGTKTKPYATTGRAYTMATNTASIKVMDNITSNETTNLNQAKDITLTSYSTDNTINSIIRGASQTSYVLNQTGGNLTLENITIDGNNVEANFPGIIIEAGKFIMENNSTIQNFKNIATQSVEKKNYGGGVLNYGTFIMNEGLITKNNSDIAGGVGNFETFNLKGGTISNNTARSTGGVYNFIGGEMIIDGGIITANESSELVGGVANNGTLTMNNGKITNNVTKGQGGGIRNGSDSVLTINAGEISYNSAQYGAGICADPISLPSRVILNGGTVLNNTAFTNGGGIHLTAGNEGVDSSLTIDGATISDNSAGTDGGGIYVNANATLDIDGGTISNNTAARAGGGIYTVATSVLNIKNGSINGNKSINNNGAGVHSCGTVNMSGGIISNNTTDLEAGGVMHCSKEVFTMTGGTISNNKARGGGGLVVLGPFIMNGGTISNNTATYDGGVEISNWNGYVGDYTYKSGTVCGNTPSNSYETHAKCPTSSGGIDDGGSVEISEDETPL